MNFLRLHSARARFVATVTTVFALIALGGVTSAPAYAADVNVTITVLDVAQNGGYADEGVTLESSDGTSYAYVTNGSAEFSTGAIAAGDYRLLPGDAAYAPSEYFALVEGQAALTVDLVLAVPVVTEPVPTDDGPADTDEPGLAPLDPTDSAAGTSAARAPGTTGLSGNTVFVNLDDEVGSYAVDTLLYKRDGSGLYAPTPYATMANSSSFSFSDLPDGDYRVAYRDPASQRTLVWRSLVDNGSPITAPPEFGSCYYEFSMASSSGDRVLADVALAGEQIYPATCVSPAYSDPADPVVTGTVAGYAGYIVYVNLYKADGTFIDSSQLENVSGNFSLSGVRESGDYYIKVVTHVDSTYLPLLLGDAEYTEWAKDAATETAFANAHSFAIDVVDGTGLADHDTTLIEGSRLSGRLASGDAGVVGGITLTNVGNPLETYYAPVGAGQQWAVVVPSGGTYSLYASSPSGDFVPQYWPSNVTLSSAGAFGPFDFDVVLSPPALHATLTDVDNSFSITAYLYFKDTDGLWSLVDYRQTALLLAKFDHKPGTAQSLAAGEYRLRFRDASDKWLAATQFTTGLLPSTWNAPVAGPVCFIDLTMGNGPVTGVNASFDSVAQTQVCAAEPPVEGDVTGHLVSSPATGNVNLAGRTVELYNESTYVSLFATTNSAGIFTFPAVRNGRWQLRVESLQHVAGTHDYYFYEYYETGAGANLGDIVPLRDGNVSGTVANWNNATMSGATATVYGNSGCGCPEFSAVGDPVRIDSTGHFEAPGIDEDGSFAVLIEFDGTYVNTFVGGGFSTPASPFTGTAELDYTYPSAITLPLVNLVSITGTVTYGTHAVGEGEIGAFTLDGLYRYHTEINEDGSYELMVAPNQSYLVGSSAWGLLPQYYGFTFDPNSPNQIPTGLAVGTVAKTGIDLSLVASDVNLFEVYTSTPGAPPAAPNFPGVEVHLYKNVNDAWEEVATVTSDPRADLTSPGGGDYRLRFSKNGEWLAIDQADWNFALPPYDLRGGDSNVDACYLDFADLDQGDIGIVDVILDPDAAASDCGPEIATHDVVGSTVESDGLLNGPIAGQVVTLTGSTGPAQTRTTDVDGVFTFEDLVPDTYTLTIASALLPSGHAYVGLTQTVVVVDDDLALSSIELIRYGNVELNIYNWDSRMAGATAQVALEGPAGVWTPVGLADTVDSSGYFSIPGIAETGGYRIWVDYPTGYVDGYIPRTDNLTAVADIAGIAEEDITDAITVAFVMVSGIVRLGAAPVSGALVSADYGNGIPFETTTGSDGSFSLVLPADLTFTLEANKAGLVRAMDTAFVVGFVPMANVDLEMHYATFLTRVTDAAASPLTTATVHLYSEDTGVWQEVASDTLSTTYLWTNLSGSYRIRVSDGSDWLAIGANACFVDFAPAIAGNEYVLNLTAVAPTGGVDCAPDAVPVVVAPPATPGTSGSGASGSGTKKPVATFTAPAATTEVVEVEPTSTPTPSPTASETETDAPDDASGVEAPATASAPDFAWAFWVAGILVLFVLAGGAVYLVRRRP